MRLLLPSFAAVVTAIALAASLVSTSATASAGEPEIDTLTTQLQPGWNMAGWLGSEAEVSELFDAIPALRSVWAWDGDHQRYIWATRNGNARGLSRLRTGIGVWLLVDGDEPVEWTRAVAPEGMLLSLHEGRNLVGWSGRQPHAIQRGRGTVWRHPVACDSPERGGRALRTVRPRRR